MIDFYDVIAASKGIAIADEFAALWGRKISGGYVISTYTGTLPATLQTVAGYLAGYKIWGNTGRVGVETENLFDAATAYGSMYDSATGTLVGAASTLTFIRNKFDSSMVGVPITISMHADDVPVARVYIRCTIGGANIDSNAIANGRTGTMTVTVTPTSVNDDWRITFGTGTGDLVLSNIMLSAGSTAIPYVPYGYKLPIASNSTTTDIYIGDTQLAKDEYVDSAGKIYRWADITGLNEPLCGIATYTDSLDLSTGTLTRRIKKVVLTGSASEPIRPIGRNAPYAYYYEPTDMKGPNRKAIVCTHVPFSWDYTGETPAIVIGSTLNTLFINFGKTTMDAQPSGNTVEGFKEFCAAQYAAGTPVTIWYVLAEPEISTVTVPSGLTGTIEGYLIQDGTPTPEVPIYPTANGTKQADGTYSIESAYLTPTDPPTPLPQIPTFAGETTIGYGGTGAQPEKVELKYRR